MNRDFVDQVLTARDIQVLVRKYNKLLVDRGYYLAGISTPPTDYSRGTVILEVDKGRMGKMAFYKMPPTDKGAARGALERYSGRFYSERQLRQRLSDLKEGNTFDYNEFYRDVYTINSHPDLTMNTDLRVRKVDTSYPPQRFVDMDFMVKERVPLHGVLAFGNSGTKATGDWRPSLTLQDLNLTKHDDVLSINLGPISENLNDMKSFGGSYYLPYNYANGGGLTLYGGYSDLDADEVVPGINVRGNGYFAGLMGSYRLINSDKHLLSLSLGVVYRYISDQLVLAGENGEADYELDKRTVVLVPWSFAISYSSGKPDALGGRNFLTSQTSANIGGFPGVSDDDKVEALRANAKATYFIERIQVARLQPLFGGSLEAPREPWTFFLKLDSQLASGPLVPAEQKAIGGMDTVRGYPERVVQGDDGISGSIELRTPLAEDWLSSPFRTSKEREAAKRKGQSVDRLQLALFTDGGYVRSRDSLSDIDNYSLFSLGAGLRLSVTSYFQARFDWGVPFGYDKSLESGDDPVKSYGRFHLSAQVQF
jgi:hemolysin activation/secretion protein